MGTGYGEASMKDAPRTASLQMWRYALIMACLFWLAHAAGFRSYTSVLAGTHSGPEWTHYAGVLYLLLYMIWVAIVPIFAIAGGILWLQQAFVGAADDSR